MTTTFCGADLLTNRIAYTETFLKIRDKEAQIVPFRLNTAQRKIIRLKAEAKRKGKRPRFITLKARREGVTTLEQAENFWTVATKKNTQVVTLAHHIDASEKIFRIANLFYEQLPENLQPHRLTEHSKRELNFPEMNSLFYIGTAGKRGFGRGDTLNRVHWSEVAWSIGGKSEQEKLLAGLTEACSHGAVSLESTANGVGDLFHSRWQEAKLPDSEWTPIFLTWWDDPLNRVELSEEEARALIADYTEEERDLVARVGLDVEQIRWRRRAKGELKKLFAQEYPEDDATCFIVSGNCFFDKLLLQAILNRAEDPIENRGDGELRIWQLPIPGHRYAAGGDVAEGTPTGNFSVLDIIDVETMLHVATLRGHWKPEDFGTRCAELGRAYNTALLAIERNNHGHSTLNTLSNQIGYPNLYRHQDYDPASGQTTPRLGWPTDSRTRPLMLDKLRADLENGHLKTADRTFLSEAMTFVKKGDRYEGADDCMDDTVISKAIALQARESVLGTTVRVSAAHVNFVLPVSSRVFPPGGIGEPSLFSGGRTR